MQFLICFSLSIYSLILYYYNKLKTNIILCILLSLLGLWGLLTFLSLRYIYSVVISYFLLKVGFSFGILAHVAFLFLIIVSLPKSLRSYVYSCIGTALATALILSITLYDELVIVYSQTHRRYIFTFASIMFPVSFTLMSLIEGIIVIDAFSNLFVKSLRHIDIARLESKLQLIILLAAIVITVHGNLAIGIVYIFLSESMASSFFYLHSFILASVIALAVSHFTNPLLPYLIMARPIELYVIEQSGIPIYRYQFVRELKYDDFLISGMLSVFIRLGKCIFGSSALKYIDWEDLKLTIISKQNLAFILVTETYNDLIYNALNAFSEKFLEKFSAELSDKDFKSKIYLFREADDLIKEIFTFVI